MSYFPFEDSNIFNVQASKASSINTQGATSTFADLTNSSITYNCNSSPAKVVYEYTTSFVRTTTNTYGVAEFKLVQYNTTSSAWEDVDSSQYITYGFAGGTSYPRNNKTLTFTIPPWEGNKQLKVQWKIITGSMNAHATERILELNGTENNSYLTKPFLTIYSVRS